MFLHLGGTTVVNMDEVIAVLDLGKIQFIEGELKTPLFGKKVVDISEGEAKTLVVTDDMVILSPISALTLQKRTEIISLNKGFCLIKTGGVR